MNQYVKYALNKRNRKLHAITCKRVKDTFSYIAENSLNALLDETEGKMSYEIKVSPKHVPMEKVGKDMAPQTGLETSAWKWAIVGMYCILAGTIVAVEWRKERKNEE